MALTWQPTRTARAIQPATGIISTCPREDDILYYLRRRQSHWLNTSYALTHGLWQRAVDDKLLGYIYARSLGVATPSVLFCDPQGPIALPETWPESWGCCFAIKPLYGFNDFGVMLVEHGVDRFTGAILGGREDVLEHLRTQGVPQLHRSTVYVETIVRPEAASFDANATPPDYKFLTFGSEVASVAIIAARKTKEACMAWVDKNYQRTDQHGCVCKEINAFTPCSYKHCDLGFPKRPVQWASMVETAARLGRAIGVHMRIDLYSAGRKGTPVLGEFTPWHANGKMHCDMHPLRAPFGRGRSDRSPSATPRGATYRRNGLSGKRDHVDACYLGRVWREHGEREGGKFDPRPPQVLRGWPALMYNERAKCLAATKLLAPPRRARERLQKHFERQKQQAQQKPPPHQKPAPHQKQQTQRTQQRVQKARIGATAAMGLPRRGAMSLLQTNWTREDLASDRRRSRQVARRGRNYDPRTDPTSKLYGT